MTTFFYGKVLIGTVTNTSNVSYGCNNVRTNLTSIKKENEGLGEIWGKKNTEVNNQATINDQDVMESFFE